MIRQHFGIAKDPFITGQGDTPLLAHQQRHFDILRVHSEQGGFCLILGEPGTGKTVLKHHIIRHDTKHWITLKFPRIDGQAGRSHLKKGLSSCPDLHRTTIPTSGRMP